jgi:hypothetical protein
LHSRKQQKPGVGQQVRRPAFLCQRVNVRGCSRWPSALTTNAADALSFDAANGTEVWIFVAGAMLACDFSRPAQNFGTFRDIAPHARNGETHYIQHQHSGAEIAPRHCGAASERGRP